MNNPISNLYRPIAPWSGRLILPQPSQRKPDGGVFIQIQNAPSSHRFLVGKQAWVKWHSTSHHTLWLSRATLDLKFDSTTYNSIEKTQAIHPKRLDGWQKVSPLESLAGARPDDDVQVELNVISATQEGNSWVLSIGDEPYQIAGVTKGLVTFVGPAGDRRYRVRHYNPASKAFNGPEEIVSCPDAGAIRSGQTVEQSSLVNIEKSPLNAGGWYIYGHSDSQGTFVVAALEPLEAMQLVATQMTTGRQETQDYYVASKWQNLPQRRIEKTLVDNNSKVLAASERTAALRERRTRELWYLNDVALTIHTFGWRGGPRGNNPPLGLAPGHFSFGFAKVIRDEFTGHLRFDLVHRQVYAHNKEGIISGAIRWHAYVGSLKRGWMYTVPISEVMLRMPEFTVPYKLGDRTFDPLKTIEQELAFTCARYRTGPGNGASVVTPATSCVKDSCQSLFAAINRLDAEVLNDPVIRRWMQDNSQSFDAQRFQRLDTLLKDVLDRMLIPLGYVPKGWRGDREYLAAHRQGGLLGNTIEALRSWKTMLPRRAEMELAQVMARHGATFWDIKGAMLGGEVPGIVPIPPGTLL
ncbi:hypothetical protein H6G20_04190 [Desertifilum sp. FACHB-1129]|uniref:Uncharacterized protein n=1 Tax=Desertifilum tharense IPPAS B-1220 TaxID=1781255 RepID=A0A1E5QSA6_9CYAN|nr:MULTISPECIES: hypothetical protein [Desertifilum]MDA0208682.1 hypothetical protein [Cyanobacteria bacterium FC1]MBD2310882.1 hypothetical protein [Desertifilum sp. FACHB-1129]MBD2321287.1 hypothetical protein [Desertifilum sp. FACHB-866]MBD2331406.1 hypothetical protein [Desertifilum sp. FACHB-868]OEJ77223.1 hypothetical protein BH720_00680 [Desertifilum tharense IPPAS B-1220]